MSRWVTAFQAVRELGLKPVLLYGLYKFGVCSGHFRRVFRAPQDQGQLPASAYQLADVTTFPNSQALADTLGKTGQETLLAAADEVLVGRVRLFGGEPVLLNLVPPEPIQHWTAYEGDSSRIQAPYGDIKYIWEPCRFGWAYTLEDAPIVKHRMSGMPGRFGCTLSLLLRRTLLTWDQIGFQRKKLPCE